MEAIARTGTLSSQGSPTEFPIGHYVGKCYYRSLAEAVAPSCGGVLVLESPQPTLLEGIANDLRLVELQVSEQSLLLQVGALRVRAWAARSPEIATRSVWLDEFDAVGRHFGVTIGRQLIAAARVSFHETLASAPDPEDFLGLAPPPPLIASFNRLVIDPDYQGLGLSVRLVEARLKAAEQAGCRSAVTSIWPEERRMKRMERLGFVRAGLTKVYSSMTYGPAARFMVMTCSLLR